MRDGVEIREAPVTPSRHQGQEQIVSPCNIHSTIMCGDEDDNGSLYYSTYKYSLNTLVDQMCSYI